MSPNNSPNGSELQDGDYYFDENGLMVLTAQYLKRRGYCCKNGCRHCPYGFIKKERSTDDLPEGGA